MDDDSEDDAELDSFEETAFDEGEIDVSEIDVSEIDVSVLVRFAGDRSSDNDSEDGVKDEELLGSVDELEENAGAFRFRVVLTTAAFFFFSAGELSLLEDDAALSSLEDDLSELVDSEAARVFCFLFTPATPSASTDDRLNFFFQAANISCRDG